MRREEDYVEVSLDGDIRYNPLNNSLDPYAQAFNIASIITSIWGKGKEPFWQQSYTDLVRYMIMLHRIRDGYVTMVDLFRTVISAGKLEEMLTEVGLRFTSPRYIGISKDDYRKHESLLLSTRLCSGTRMPDQYLIAWTEELENLLTQETTVAVSIYRRRNGRPVAARPFRQHPAIGIGSTGSSSAPRSRPRSFRASLYSSRCLRPIPTCAVSSAHRRNSMTASLASRSTRPRPATFR